ncbi:hypothetical protein H6F61_16925 [Cyanobacteria bacterium FACHB-472]|nr:hypothetical protein [Cyanobacteria bacterium FACHB-472]
MMLIWMVRFYFVDALRSPIRTSLTTDDRQVTLKLDIWRTNLELELIL